MPIITSTQRLEPGVLEYLGGQGYLVFRASQDNKGQEIAQLLELGTALAVLVG